MAKKQKLNGHAPPAADHSHIAFAEAVAEGKEIIKQMDGEQRRHQMRLGQLADRVDDRNTATARWQNSPRRSAIAACTLKRLPERLSRVGWQGKEAPGPVSYAVLRELQDHPDREAIVKKNPKITKREAQEIMREWKQQREGKQKKSKSGDWKADERKRWLRRRS